MVYYQFDFNVLNLGFTFPEDEVHQSTAWSFKVKLRSVPKCVPLFSLNRRCSDVGGPRTTPYQSHEH